uniref:CSON000851 protein n=1 Tax=Culicoides sonorensis TaxID=179676 RepID=A0A336MGN5_CULSO
MFSWDVSRELTELHKLSDEAASKLVCIAQGTNFDSNKKELEFTEEDAFGFRNYQCKYGLFRFSSEYWCSERSVGGLCNISCKSFLDDDLRDDLACVLEIQKNIAIYNSWGYDWPGKSKSECDSDQIILECENEKEKWRSTDDCLLKYPELPKIVWKDSGQNGVRALKHEFPHAAAIGWYESDTEIKWACGGSLITEDTILTAAHCTFSRQMDTPPNVVRLGDLNLVTDDDAMETQQYEIQSIIRHPDYRRHYNDIALIKLKSKVNITNFVIPGCLWPTHDIPSDIKLEACGFGQTEFGGDISSILNKVILTYLDTKNCENEYTGVRLLRDGLDDRIHLCANDKTGQNMDTCEGDSGGPLEMKLQLANKVVPFIVGVTAFGKLCGSKGSPGVYTRVSSFIEWIREHTPDLPNNPLECAVKYQNARIKNLSHLSRSGYEDYVRKDIFGDVSPFARGIPSVMISNRYILTSAQSLNEL